ncbi:MAG: YgiQ family radical SAM protein, partial [Bacteroidales bacterium]
AYTPGDKSGFRPDYASVVYSNILKKLFPDVPVILGGVEASLRRFTHYDYWSDMLKPSILVEAKADLLIYGQGIQPLKALMEHIKNGGSIETAKTINQLAYLTDNLDTTFDNNCIKLPSHEDCLRDKKLFAKSFTIIETESNKLYAKRLIQKCDKKYVVVNPQFLPMTSAEIDSAYNLPYTRMPHPRYLKRGTILAYEMIRHSVTMHSGCFGGCSFCSISMHQGKFISSRSENSILNEIKQTTKMSDFKGYLSDLGGPTANMYEMQGVDLKVCEKCSRYSCIYPKICNNLNDNHKPLIDIYKKAGSVQGIKKVFIGSGLRYDLFIGRKPADDKKNHYTEYLKLLVKNHVSGRLKVAPEHTSDKVLAIMRKPSFNLYSRFKYIFDKISFSEGLNQQIVPYFISSHPGCTLQDMVECAVDIKHTGIQPEQVQDMTPTPMTLSSVMYYTGTDPYTGKPLYVARNTEDKRQQKLMFFWYKKEFRQEIIGILKQSKLNYCINKLFDKKT